MDKEIIDKIKKFVEEECKKPTSKYGFEPYEFHFIPVVKYTLMLAEKLNLNEEQKEIVELAAWLHDMGSIVYGREEHHITGAKLAEEKLRELNYPEEKIQMIKKCILNHRGSVKRERVSIEEQIIAEADALSNFENIPGIFKAAFIFENQTQGQAKETTKRKLVNKWNQLSLKESKEIIKPKYEAMLLLLN